MELKNIFYITVNKINGHFYFGVHETNPEIFDGYIGEGIYRQCDAKKKENLTNPFASAVRKYGYENFKRTTIRIFPGTKEGRQLALDYEAAIVTETLIKSKECYNVRAGGIEGAYRPGKRVYQYDKCGNYLRSYMSAKEAAMCIGCENVPAGKVAIKSCCKGKLETAYGFVWSFTKEFKKVSWNRPIAQYTLTGKFMRKWNSIKEAESELNYKGIRQSVWEQQKGKHRTYMGYIWRWYENDDDVAPLDNRCASTQVIPIVMYDLNMENPVEYENIRACQKEHPEFTRSCITECCKGKRKTHMGHIFQFKQVEDIV